MNTDQDGVQDADLVRASSELEHAREKLVVSITAVEREIARSLDWRQWVRRKPGIALALAFALGVFLGRRG